MKIFTLLFFVIFLLPATSTMMWSQTPTSATTSPSASAATEIPQLSICYNKEFPPITYAPFSLVTVDSSYPTTYLEILTKSGKIAFCHLSLGKVKPQQGWFAPLAEAGVLKKNSSNSANSSDSATQHIDLSKPAWEDLLIGALIPQLIKKGFNGLFLDDLDLIAQQGQQGQVAALINNIRKNFPQLKLIANGGLNFLPTFAPHIDYILLENRIANKQKLTSLSEISTTLKLLKKGKKANPKLIAFALDYFATHTTSLNTQHLVFISNLRRLHWEYGLISCVTVESLDAAPIRPLK